MWMHFNQKNLAIVNISGLTMGRIRLAIDMIYVHGRRHMPASLEATRCGDIPSTLWCCGSSIDTAVTPWFGRRHDCATVKTQMWKHHQMGKHAFAKCEDSAEWEKINDTCGKASPLIVKNVNAKFEKCVGPINKKYYRPSPYAINAKTTVWSVGWLVNLLDWSVWSV